MIEARLQELREEWEKGTRQLEILDRQRGELRETLLRIEGAVQVLEELSRSETRPALAQIS
jgi:prefoldin subunit 5